MVTLCSATVVRLVAVNVSCCASGMLSIRVISNVLRNKPTVHVGIAAGFRLFFFRGFTRS